MCDINDFSCDFDSGGMKHIWAANFTSVGGGLWVVHAGASFVGNRKQVAGSTVIVLSGGEVSCSEKGSFNAFFDITVIVQTGGFVDTDCFSEKVKLLYEPGASILWPTGSDGSSRLAQEDSTYAVTTTNNGGKLVGVCMAPIRLGSETNGWCNLFFHSLS